MSVSLEPENSLLDHSGFPTQALLVIQKQARTTGRFKVLRSQLQSSQYISMARLIAGIEYSTFQFLKQSFFLFGADFPHDSASRLRRELASCRGGHAERKRVFTVENARMDRMGIERWGQHQTRGVKMLSRHATSLEIGSSHAPVR